MTTPKILYQTWKTKDLPPKFEKNRSKWLKSLPMSEGWTHILLTDEDLRDLVKNNFPKYIEMYDSFTFNIERVDFARYIMMYLGGVYADLDTYPVKSIDNFINMNKVILGREPLEHAEKLYSRKVVLCNAFMISPPKNQLWTGLMDYIMENYEHNYKPVDNTGPMAMTTFYEKNPNIFKDSIITDPCVFFPLLGDGTISKRCNLKRDTFVVHEWENTWVRNPFDHPIWFNRRYWFYALMTLYFLFYIYLFGRK